MWSTAKGRRVYSFLLKMGENTDLAFWESYELEKQKNSKLALSFKFREGNLKKKTLKALRYNGKGGNEGVKSPVQEEMEEFKEKMKTRRRSRRKVRCRSRMN